MLYKTNNAYVTEYTIKKYLKRKFNWNKIQLTTLMETKINMATEFHFFCYANVVVFHIIRDEIILLVMKCELRILFAHVW